MGGHKPPYKQCPTVPNLMFYHAFGVVFLTFKVVLENTQDPKGGGQLASIRVAEQQTQALEEPASAQGP